MKHLNLEGLLIISHHAYRDRQHALPASRSKSIVSSVLVLLLVTISLAYSGLCAGAEETRPAGTGSGGDVNVGDRLVQIRNPAPKSSNSTGTLLKGQVTYTVPKGTALKLKLASVPTSGVKLMDRDWDGKLFPARLDQEITAKTTEDLYVDDNKVIPEGTIFHGRVSKIIPPKRLSRPGSLALSFDTITTPDGRKFAFRAEANNSRESTNKTKAKGLGIVAAHAAGGAIVGAMVAYQLFGMDKTIALHGYNIAGGAALGAVAATTYAVMKHGPQAVLEPGEDLNMEIDSDLLLPAASAPKVKKAADHLAGVEIEIIKSKLRKDGLDGYELKLEAAITNDSDLPLKSMDLFLEDDNGSRFPVTADDAWESEMLFTVEPHSIKHVQFSFQLEFPKLRRKLVWLDHRSRAVLISQRLP